MDETFSPEATTIRAETPEERERSRELFLQADGLNYANQSAEAEKLYRASMDATGDHGAFFHLAQGQIYVIHDNLEYALTAFEIASQIDDSLEFVHINLGLTYRKLSGRLRSANLVDKANEMMAESLASLERAT